MLLGANWKSEGTVSKVRNIVAKVLDRLVFDPSKLDLLVMPSALHLPMVKGILKHPHIQLCSQNNSYYGTGAYTGEVAASQLKDMGIRWSMVGASERRAYFVETEEARDEK